MEGGLTITDRTIYPDTWIHGTVELRALVENPTPTSRRIVIESKDASRNQTARIATLLANGGTLLQVNMPVPHEPYASEDGDFLVRVDNFRPNEFSMKSFYARNRYYGTGDSLPFNVIVSKEISAEKLKAHLKDAASTSKPSLSGLGAIATNGRHGEVEGYFCADRVESFSPFRFEGDGALWPQHWRTYSTFDGFMIAAADYELMPAEVRVALRDFAAGGGDVTLLGMETLPEEWRFPSETQKAVQSRPFGVSEALYGFGSVRAVSVESIDGIDSNNWVKLVGAWTASAHPWLADHHNDRKNQEVIPVPVELTTSVSAFILILVFFVILVGPFSLILVRRKNRRMWILGLVPAISLLFAVIIFAYALYSEGVTPLVRQQAFTLLHQQERRAATLGAIGVYSPLNLTGGLHFDLGTDVAALGRSVSTSIKYGRDLHIASGWVEPRVPSFIRVRRCEERTERLVVVEREDGALEVVNGLGAKITRLRIGDASRVFETSDLKAGEKRVLSTSVGECRAGLLERVQKHVLDRPDAGWNIVEILEGKADPAKADVLQPGPRSYVAVLEGAPFIENPLAYRSNESTAESIVVGWY